MLYAFGLSLAFSQRPDSSAIYYKIKSKAEKHKITNWLYHSVFVDPRPQAYPTDPSSHEEKVVNPYLNYEKRIIRNVRITVRDPFYLAALDSTDLENAFVEKLANKVHIKSRTWVIQNKLLFKRGDQLDALKISESERLIRNANYINDAAIYVHEIKGSDSVDVNVVVQDKWSITAPVILTDVGGNVRIREDNMFGLGHQFDQYTSFDRKGFTAFSGRYNIANIDHSFINGALFYDLNANHKSTGISFDRPFYSPLAKWAFGLSAVRSVSYYERFDSVNSVSIKSSANRSDMDLWLGRNFKLKSKRKFFDQSTNITTSLRYYTNFYDKRPLISDIKNNYLNGWSLIGSTGISVQQYYKDKFIYRFGTNEDIPQGFQLQVLYGINVKELSKTKYYLGLEIARARKLNNGYFSSSIAYGVLFNQSISNNTTLNYKFNYISNLYRFNNWYVRQFVKFKTVYGDNKAPGEELTLKEEELYGFKSSKLGSSKMVLNYEVVAYAPYNLIGFRFAPVLLTGVGTIGEINKTEIHGNLYQAYALGLMIRNENLLVNTFQVSVGIYPHDNSLFRYNPVTSFTLKIDAFNISKPAFISYD